MNKYKRTLLLFAVLVTALAAMITTLHGQRQNPNASASPQDKLKKMAEDFYTITDYDTAEPAEPQKRALRQARGKRYNNKSLKSDEIKKFIITEESQSGFGGFPSHSPAEPALPVATSDAIAIGQTTDAQAHLSNDKTSIYSEFSFQISSVLKNSTEMQIIPTASITATRGGGMVRFSSGKIVFRAFEGKPFPRLGRHYLLFLKYNEEGQDFSILTAYELRAGHVFPLDGLSTDGSVIRELAVQQSYQGLSETDFLNEVREAILKASTNGPEKG